MTGDLRPADPDTRPLRVNEIFYSIQGESTHAGLPCTFVRLTACPLRCTWCDTEYAFYEGRDMTREEILERVRFYRCPTVEVTGGEPLAQPGAAALLRALADEGYTVLLETAGSHPIEGVDPRVRIVLDVKCPGSGMMEHNLWGNLERLKDRDEVKFVVGDRRDYEWAREVLETHGLPARCTVLFSPVFGVLRPEELADWILEDRLEVRLQLQLHKYIWSPAARGV